MGVDLELQLTGISNSYMSKNPSYILVLNCGSSSIKLNVFETEPEYRDVYETYIERVKNHSASLEKFFKKFKKTHKEVFENISKVGHRVVHGGEKYTKPTRLTRKIVEDLEKLNPLAPLHNPANIAGIKTCMKLFPRITHYAVFDTAYYSTLPEKAFLYALPYGLYKKHGIRRYGFHGTSHEYVVNEAIKNLVTSRVRKNTRIVSCHLGNGVSITASTNGKAIDTSMGFTPLEGVPMGTRSGDIDPAIIFHLMKNAGGMFTKTKLEKIHTMLEKDSGLKGLSELSHDMRDLRDAYFGKNKMKKGKAARALSVYCYRIAKYIGSYIVALGGVDCIVFTATIGEKADYVRKWVCEYLAPFGVILDMEKNKKCTNTQSAKLALRNNVAKPTILKTAVVISKKNSKVKVLVITTREEKQILTACKKLPQVNFKENKSQRPRDTAR